MSSPGGDDADQRRDGDYLDKDARYARTDEYVEILKQIWTGDAPVSHEGAHYRFEAASPAVRSVQRPRIPIYFGGASCGVRRRRQACRRLRALGRDLCSRWPRSPQRCARPRRRMDVRSAFSLSLRPILADTRRRGLGAGRTDPRDDPEGSAASLAWSEQGTARQ